MLTEKLHRIRAMSLPEIFYRFGRDLSELAEKRSLLRLKEPENLDDFLRRHNLLNGSPTTKDKVFQKFLSRNIFPWQKEDADKIRGYFANEFSSFKESTLKAASRAAKNELTIFDRTEQFGEKIDWHRDILGGKSIPLKYWKNMNYRDVHSVREVKYVWELNRHQHFVTLAKAGFLTGGEKYTKALFSQWVDWIEKNPYKFGINWTSALEAAFRLISWTWALQFAKTSATLSSELYFRILQSVENHGRFIEEHLSQYSSANNHLIGEALGLVYAGCYYPELQQSEKWREKGFQILSSEFEKQVHADGVIKEQSTFYQKYIFYFGVLAQIAADHANIEISEVIPQTSEKVARFIYHVMDCSGNVPAIGDDDGGEAVHLSEENENPFQSLLSTAAVLYDVSEFKNAAAFFAEETFWFTGFSGQQKFNRPEVSKGRANVTNFSDGGYVIIRSDRSDAQQHFMFDYGPIGLGRLAAHGHADALSVLFHVNGEPVLIDSGTFLYLGAGKWRDYFKGTSAHNTLTVDERDQSESVGVFQWGRKAKAELTLLDENDDAITFSAHHDGYKKLGVTHKRHVKFDRDSRWIISDELHGNGVHKADVYFHLAPCIFERDDSKEIICVFNKSKIRFQFQSPQVLTVNIINGRKNPIMGWHSARFGEKTAHPVIRVSLQDRLPLLLTTRMDVENVENIK